MLSSFHNNLFPRFMTHLCQIFRYVGRNNRSIPSSSYAVFFRSKNLTVQFRHIILAKSVVPCPSLDSISTTLKHCTAKGIIQEFDSHLINTIACEIPSFHTLLIILNQRRNSVFLHFSIFLRSPIRP